MWEESSSTWSKPLGIGEAAGADRGQSRAARGRVQSAFVMRAWPSTHAISCRCRSLGRMVASLTVFLTPADSLDIEAVSRTWGRDQSQLWSDFDKTTAKKSALVKPVAYQQGPVAPVKVWMYWRASNMVASPACSFQDRWPSCARIRRIRHKNLVAADIFELGAPPGLLPPSMCSLVQVTDKGKQLPV